MNITVGNFGLMSHAMTSNNITGVVRVIIERQKEI